jgi:ubiquitin-protein ligase E3 A
MDVGFGEMAAVELLPGGAELAVTPANRRLYVSLYVKHLLEVRQTPA